MAIIDMTSFSNRKSYDFLLLDRTVKDNYTNSITCEIDQLKFHAHAPSYANSSDLAKLKTARMSAARNLNRCACNSLRAESSHDCELEARITAS